MPRFLRAREVASRDFAATFPGREAVHRSLYVRAKTMLPNDILGNLDHHVGREAVRLPVAAKIDGTTEKHVLREAVRPVVTDAVYRRMTSLCLLHDRFAM